MIILFETVPLPFSLSSRSVLARISSINVNEVHNVVIRMGYRRDVFMNEKIMESPLEVKLYFRAISSICTLLHYNIIIGLKNRHLNKLRSMEIVEKGATKGRRIMLSKYLEIGKTVRRFASASHGRNICAFFNL